MDQQEEERGARDNPCQPAGVRTVRMPVAQSRAGAGAGSANVTI
jgi:hypothetical protein